MQTIFGIFSLESAEAAVADLEQRLGTDAVNIIAPEVIKERMSNGRSPTAGPGQAAPVAAPTLAHFIGRKRPVFLGEAGSVYAVNALAARIVEMAQSPAPTKTQGNLKVALEEYGVRTSYAEAYATAVTHGYVLVFAEVAKDTVLEMAENFQIRGGREIFNFQRLE